jgi:hypothetical protein
MNERTLFCYTVELRFVVSIGGSENENGYRKRIVTGAYIK